MRVKSHTRLPPENADFPIISKIESVLLERAGGLEKLRSELPGLIIQEIEKVVDTENTGRIFVRELEKTEKTYIGTRMEILFRRYFDLPKGKLDLQIDGIDIDIKNTVGNTWMIPRAIIDRPCILVATDEEKGTCFFGLLVARAQHLTSADNQDKKLSVSAAGFAHIHWVLVDAPYKKSLWVELGEIKGREILNHSTGNERIGALFREMLRKPVARKIIQVAARQKDYMKRLRKNGGARDLLAKEGIAVLSGKYDQEILKELKLPQLSNDEFLSIKAENPEELAILKKYNVVE